jgi:hypothetical protein
MQDGNSLHPNELALRELEFREKGLNGDSGEAADPTLRVRLKTF